MSFIVYEKLFTAKAVKAGFSQDNIQKCLAYAKPLIDKGLPVIYNTANLCALVGYNKNYLKRAALHTQFFYRKFFIRKRNGKARLIVEPLPSLKEIQLWILHNILYEVKASRYAKAYIKGRNIVDNVRYHREKDIVLRIDIKDFFPSIGFSKIQLLFEQLGYSSNISNLLTKLCCVYETLPQGAPTSPYLSNLVLKNFDKRLAEFCVAKNIRYTRYADDLTFSFAKTIDPNEVRLFVENELSKEGFSANPDKTQILTPNKRQIVTGIVVNKVLQIPKIDRKLIRQEMYYISKFGLRDHMKKTQNTKASYLLHLLGKTNYALQINPEDKEMKKYKAIIWQMLNQE
ncbi:MAG: reverse transcriptase [Citrobacter freundii]|nr:MAG: reverse transcriptase [Citrobacter freundii]